MSSRDRDVAIVGMSALFPGADSLAQYWQNIVDGTCSIEEAPDSWAYPYYDPDTTENGRIYTRKGGFLADLADFNPAEFGIMPNSIEGGDPDGYLVLRLAREALADAGYLKRDFDRSKAGIILGRGNYLNRGQASLMQYGLVLDQTVDLIHNLVPDLSDEALKEVRQSLKRSLPPFEPETISGLVPNVVTGRVANRLDLMGPNYLVDAACASTLIAIDQGIKELHSGRCDLVLAGGVHAASPPAIGMVFCQIGALSRGDLKPFGAGAGGTLLGEGIGIVALKRRADAERDGDRVYAVIKGVGVSSDGQAKGLLAPRFEGEVLALETGYENAEVDPKTIGLIEAHGTGIPLGDQTEVAALSEVFGERYGAMPNCAIGSVKSMIGHCLPAAGAAGVIKTALALYHKVLPQTLCDEPNPNLSLETSRFYVNNSTRPWVHGDTEVPRRAGVNSFGFGGINAHAVLEEVPQPKTMEPSTLQWASEAIAISGDTREKLLSNIDKVIAKLEGENAPRLCDLAYTLANVSPEGERLVVVTKSNQDLLKKLTRSRKALEKTERHSMQSRGGVFFSDTQLETGKTAFLFPGEGAQYTNMLSDLCVAFPSVRRWFDRLDQAFIDDGDVSPSSIIFPAPTGLTPEQRKAAEQRLFDMDFGSEVLTISNLALSYLLKSLGVSSDVMVGHSTGEFAALVASGTFNKLSSPEKLLQKMRELHEVHQGMERKGTITTGTLLAAGALDHELIQQEVTQAGDDVFLAMDNCRNQAVIYAPVAKAETLRSKLKSLGAIVLPLPFDRAYHTTLFEDVAAAVRKFFETVDVKPAQTPLYSCSTATIFPTDDKGIRDTAAKQFSTRVRFRETVQKMYQDGVRTFIEVGPRDNLTAFVKDVLHDQEFTAIASNVQRLTGLQQIQHLLAELYVKGVVQDLTPMFASRACEKLDSELSSKPVNKGMRLNIDLPVMKLTEPSPLEPPLMSASSIEQSSQAKVVELHPQSTTNTPSTGSQLSTVETKKTATSSPSSVPDSNIVTPSVKSPASQAAPSPKPNSATPAPISAQRSSANDPRLAALQGHFDLMNQFMQQQARTMESLVGGAPASVSAPSSTNAFQDRYPLLGKVVSQDAKQLVCERTYQVERDLYLIDHTIGVNGAVSALQPNKLALPVVPLTFSMEAIAEAAHYVTGGQGRVTGMRNIGGHRWIALERECPVHLRITADIQSSAAGHSSVQVKVIEVKSPGDTEGLMTFEGLVEVSANYAAPPTAMPFEGTPLIASETADADLYRGSMFHGPRLQGVRHLNGLSSDRLEAEMIAISTQDCFSFTRAPQFQVDPALLDACGQLLGFWSFENVHPAANLFPMQISQVQFFAPPAAAGTELIGRTLIRNEQNITLEARIEIADTQGTPLLQIDGWKDRVFPDATAQHFLDWRLDPVNSYLSESRFPDHEKIVARGLTPARSACLLGAGGIWLKTAVHIVLTPNERDQWYALPEHGHHREEWMLGFIAAKDAARQWLLERHGLQLAPIDMEIRTNEQGRSYIHSDFVGQVSFPELSIKCGKGHAAACLARDVGQMGPTELDQLALQLIQLQFDMAKSA